MAMKFNPKQLGRWIADTNDPAAGKQLQASILRDVDDEDYPLAASRMRDLRIAVGSRAIEGLLNNRDEGVFELHRVWRYHAYGCHIDLREGDWLRRQIDEGKTPEYEIPQLWLENAAYAIAGGIVFEEKGLTEWLGKRTIAAFMRPDEFGPVHWSDQPIVPYVLGLFLYWAGLKSGELPDSSTTVIDHLSAQCAPPYDGRLLSEWREKSFDGHFRKLCDKWGDRHSEPLPFFAIPIAIIATIKLRRALHLSVPAHPLLDHAVVTLPLSVGRIQSEDPFFDEVNRKIAEIAPTDEFLWRW